MKPPTLTAAQTAAERTCIQKIVQKTFKPAVSAAARPAAAAASRRRGSGGTWLGRYGFRNFIGGFAVEPGLREVPHPGPEGLRAEGRRARADHHPGAQPADDQHRHVELHRRRRRPDERDDRAHHQGPARRRAPGSRANPADEVLVNTTYASTKKLKVGGTITINSKSYKIVGLVAPTLTGNVVGHLLPALDDAEPGLGARVRERGAGRR